MAILDDYTESCDSTFPAGEELSVFELAESHPDLVHCLVPNHKALYKKMIPKDLRNRFLCFDISTPFDVVITKSDLLEKCERVQTGHEDRSG